MRFAALLAALLVGGCGLRSTIPPPHVPLAATEAAALPDEPRETLPSEPFRLRLVRRELSNGVRIALSRGAANGLVTVTFVSAGTPRFAEGVGPEATDWMARLLFRAATDRDGETVDEPLAETMFEPTVEALPEGLRVTATMPTEELPLYLALLERSLRAASFRAEDFSTPRDAALDRLRTFASSADGRLAQGMRGLLYADGDPRGRGPTARIEALEALDVSALEARHARLGDPRFAAIVVSGDLDPSAVLPLIGQRFSAWTAAEGEPAPVPPRPRDAGARLVLVEEPLARSFVRVLDRAPPFTDPDYAAFLVLEQLLGGMFGAQLNLALREREAVSYGFHARFVASASHGELELMTAVEPGRTRDVVERVLAELVRVRSGELEELELSLARTRAQQTLLATLDRPDGLARAMARRMLAGQDPGAMGPVLRAIDGLDAASIQEAARRWLRPDRAVIGVVGRADAVREVADLPLGDVVWVRGDSR